MYEMRECLSRSDNLAQHWRTHERLPGWIPFAGGSGISRGSVDGDLSCGGDLNDDSSSRQGSVRIVRKKGWGILLLGLIHTTHNKNAEWMCTGILLVVVVVLLWICRPTVFWVVNMQQQHMLCRISMKLRFREAFAMLKGMKKDY